MEEITDVAEIQTRIRQKQFREVLLAKNLLIAFNDDSGGLLQQIRSMVSAGIKEMNDAREAHRQKFDQLWNRQGGWSEYAGCAKHGIRVWNHDSIQQQVRHFQAEHCADWIRIFGEVIEDVVGGQADRDRLAYQEGYHWNKYPKAGKAGYGATNPDAGRRRYARMAATSPVPQKAAQPYTPALGVMQAHPSAGIDRWVMMENDTVGKMDQVFGLMPGATISGTTTDNIFFIKRFSSLNIDPIYFLLPTATIVAGGHHTLLEVALPLALNGLSPYVIGLYSTLFPKRGALPERPGGVRAIHRLLGVYEEHHYNHLMLNYYDNMARLAGCFLYNRISDERTWTHLARVDDRLMNRFKALPPWPRRLDVLKLAVT